MKKILIFGTIHLKDRMLKHKEYLGECGDIVRLPVLDDYSGECKTALDIIKKNISEIKWCDEMHMFWDGRSIGTVADWQTGIALGKKVIPIFVENTFTYYNAMMENWRSRKNE